MAIVGHTLHFSYSDMIEMDIKDLLDFIEEAKNFSRSE